MSNCDCGFFEGKKGDCTCNKRWTKMTADNKTLSEMLDDLKPMISRPICYAVITHLAGEQRDRIKYFETKKEAFEYYIKKEDAELISFRTLRKKGWFK